MVTKKTLGIAAGLLFFVLLCGLLAFRYYLGTLPPVTIITTLVSTTADSVSVTLHNGSQKTFTVPADIAITAEVKGNAPAPSLSTIMPGIQLRLTLPNQNANNAGAISVFSIVPPPALSPLGPNVQISGTVTARTATTLTLHTDTGIVQVLLATSTAVYTRVVTGQTGKLANDIVVGDSVNIVGVAGSNGLTAELIQL